MGYTTEEVKGKSCFEYFHPEEVPFARSVHSRGVLLDKAAVLHYARIKAKDGSWVNCECCFTVVHDVLVASTSIYQHGEKSSSMLPNRYNSQLPSLPLLIARPRSQLAPLA